MPLIKMEFYGVNIDIIFATLPNINCIFESLDNDINM